MAREKEGFREVLERLDAAYPGKEFLSRAELCSFLGRGRTFVDVHWKKYKNEAIGGYAKTKIASVLAN